MATIDTNKQLWNELYVWKNQGDEWSSGWGGVDMQWFGMLLPRIHRFLPTGTILEIAVGQGRWTQYLLPLCKSFLGVDLAEKCIQLCEERFKTSKNASFYFNDGKSLDMIENNSIDFVFSFDSLVHCEEDVIDSYLEQLSKKLKADGIGFIHHSNMEEYSSYFKMISMIPRGARLLSWIGLIEFKEHLRAHSMSAKKFQLLCNKHNLECISQEIVNWDSKRLIDCISMFCKKGSKWSRSNRVLKNNELMADRKRLGALSNLYGNQSF
jgi:SAM-dependent methyltransferase